MSNTQATKVGNSKGLPTIPRVGLPTIYNTTSFECIVNLVVHLALCASRIVAKAKAGIVARGDGISNNSRSRVSHNLQYSQLRAYCRFCNPKCGTGYTQSYPGPCCTGHVGNIRRTNES